MWLGVTRWCARSSLAPFFAALIGTRRVGGAGLPSPPRPQTEDMPPLRSCRPGSPPHACRTTQAGVQGWRVNSGWDNPRRVPACHPAPGISPGDTTRGSQPGCPSWSPDQQGWRHSQTWATKEPSTNDSNALNASSGGPDASFQGALAQALRGAAAGFLVPPEKLAGPCVQHKQKTRSRQCPGNGPLVFSCGNHQIRWKVTACAQGGGRACWRCAARPGCGGVEPAAVVW